MNNFREDLKEKVNSQGLTWDELCQWVQLSYSFGSNPLPHLRKYLGCKVMFTLRNSYNAPQFEEEGYVLVTLDESGTVEVEVYRPESEVFDPE